MRVDQAGDDAQAASVDYLQALARAGILLGVAGTDPSDATAVGEHGPTDLECRRPAIGDVGVSVQHSRG